jgi:Spy/CpxP family protein refolding chaperone
VNGAPGKPARVPPRVAAALLLTGMFAIGVVAGVALERARDRRGQQHRVRDGVPVWALPERDQRRHWARVSDKLALTPEQRAQVDSILTRRSRQLEAARAEVEPTMSAIMSSARSQIDSVLTPDQLTQIQEMRRQRAKERGR